ncbi:DUF1304 domain-containing protein [Cognatiyoonia sp. IB215446]|uniref:DUF1304 domain-containing protein n=1 Tax=Cognatiyoonia sp. IB215446 TaxID=3097355 RepID=UPI002A0F8AE7|nr:DUF1304 domain-containing protein [Cognatiyoonia sp. IB215446]MDX8349782.1 DUF1304 domain-containing protein [Cognatiyoonia sp. IB215446]
MRILALVLIALIAALHAYIAYFEIFAWEVTGPRVFASFPPELFSQTTAIAANQGIYNGFLATGLLWALLIRDDVWQRNVATCFLLFVIAAGLMGMATVSIRIFFVQSVPALIALALLLLAPRKTTIA